MARLGAPGAIQAAKSPAFRAACSETEAVRGIFSPQYQLAKGSKLCFAKEFA
jgi:hypothetical protein